MNNTSAEVCSEMSHSSTLSLLHEISGSQMRGCKVPIGRSGSDSIASTLKRKSTNADDCLKHGSGTSTPSEDQEDSRSYATTQSR